MLSNQTIKHKMRFLIHTSTNSLRAKQTLEGPRRLGYHTTPQAGQINTEDYVVHWDLNHKHPIKSETVFGDMRQAPKGR
jgi:hypothetical protein